MKGSIARQFLAVGLIIVFAFTGLLTYAYFQIKHVETQYQQALAKDAPVVGYAKEIVGDLWRLNANVRGFMLTGDEKYLQYAKETKQQISNNLEMIEKIPLIPEARREFELIRMVIDDYYKTMDSSLTMREMMGLDGAVKLLKAGGSKIDGIGNVTSGFIQVISREMNDNTRNSEQEIQTLQMVMIVSAAVIFLMAVALLLGMARRIRQPLLMVVSEASRIAGGDFREIRLRTSSRMR